MTDYQPTQSVFVVEYSIQWGENGRLAHGSYNLMHDTYGEALDYVKHYALKTWDVTDATLIAVRIVEYARLAVTETFSNELLDAVRQTAADEAKNAALAEEINGGLTEMGNFGQSDSSYSAHAARLADSVWQEWPAGF